MRALSLAGVLLLCGVLPAVSKGSSVNKTIPGILTTSKDYRLKFDSTSQASAKDHREPNMISQPTCRSKSVGGSISNISTARAWASFAAGINVLMSISLRCARVSGSLPNSIEIAASESPAAMDRQNLPPLWSFFDDEACSVRVV